MSNGNDDIVCYVIDSFSVTTDKCKWRLATRKIDRDVEYKKINV